MPNIILGNTSVIEPVKPDAATTEVERVPRPDLGNQETIWRVPDDEPLHLIVQMVTSAWYTHHSDDVPAWVESDDDLIASLIGREFDCPVGRPKDWSTGPQEDTE